MLDLHGDSLSLLFKLIVSFEVSHVLVAVLLEHRGLVHGLLVDSHAIINAVEVVHHGNAGLHDFVLLSTNAISLFESLSDGNNSRVHVNIGSLGLSGDKSCDVLARLGKHAEALLVSLKFLLYFQISLTGLTHLGFVVIQRGSVLDICLFRRNSVVLGPTLGFESSVVLCLLREVRLNSLDHLIVYLDKGNRSAHSLVEFVSSSVLLELLNLCPDIIGHTLTGTKGLEGHR